MLEFQRGIIALLKSAVDHTKAELPDGFDWKQAIALAKSHQILPMLYYGCSNSQIETPSEIGSLTQ